MEQNRLEIAHSIKSLEEIHSSIKYWHTADDVKDLIDLRIQTLRHILNPNGSLNRKTSETSRDAAVQTAQEDL